MALISQTKKSTIGEGERKILTTFQHKLNHKFVNSTIILKYIQRKKQLDNFFIFLKDIQSKINEYIDDVSTCKQPELLIFYRIFKVKKKAVSITILKDIQRKRDQKNEKCARSHKKSTIRSQPYKITKEKKTK